MANSIDPTSYKPLYLQISDILRNQIKNGGYAAGDLLPSENDLMVEYSVSRNTAQRAIEDLVRDGLAIRIQGKGTFVPKSIVEFGLHRLTSFSEEMSYKGLSPSSKVLCFNSIQADAQLAHALGIDDGDPVYQLSRVRYGDDHPMAYQRSYLPLRLCEGLDRYDFSKRSLFTVLEQEYHLKITWQNQYIKPCIARQSEAEPLEIDVGTPLLFLEGVAYLERDIPIEYKKIYYRSDLYDFSMRSVRN
ncbi:MAG: GntR family transcriptional regulator [Brevefilum sp.]|nr:GntR family transcriptional regulator [Brevefilum sp.]